MARTRRIALLHSPLTGPRFWQATADALVALGEMAVCIRLPAPEHLHPPYWLAHAATAATLLPEEGEVVLVAHSGAGVLLPAIGRLARNRTRSAGVTGYVFVDCDLPRDSASRLDLMNARDAERFRSRSVDGWLPRWSEADLHALISDERERARFVAELPRVPLAMYEERIAVPDEWPDAPCGYLGLSEHYPDSPRRAAEEGWPSRRIPGHHLLPSVDPQLIARELQQLIDDLGDRSPLGAR